MKSPAKYEEAIQLVPCTRLLTPADYQIQFNVVSYRWGKVVIVNVQLYFYDQQYIPTLPSYILEGLPTHSYAGGIAITLPDGRVNLQPGGNLRLISATPSKYLNFEIVYLTND